MVQPAPVAAIRVRLITLEDCHLCDQARAVLRRLQGAFPLEVEELAFNSPEGKALVVRHRILFPPALLLDDDYMGFGRLSERRLRKHLAARR